MYTYIMPYAGKFATSLTGFLNAGYLLSVLIWL